jgi:hypothetical protein
VRDPLGRGLEQDAVSGQAGADRQRDRQVGLAGPGRVPQDEAEASSPSGRVRAAVPIPCAAPCAPIARDPSYTTSTR